jgi:P27 family predicted phage terminase small subunit
MKKTKPPAHLSREARKIWRDIVSEYGINDTGGLAILKTGLEAYDRAAGARKAIDRDGLTVNDRFGTPKPHPLLAAERDARAQFLASLKALNLDIEPLRDGPGRPPGR